ncbi:hypothetical protein [Sinimarinibacterium sp. NLF-5-8]|uniref:hypothetical protein n=1 Tax=Sinimarinibacterium sp. NLF-5-8 TaxID=2698684 RepID=UPI00137BC796|nr:hypothetical protein [Sinimarinibacterium sp. NLF-5-8]QHS09553.1 hypothetical protein GT972_04850 [Sinimarinibacterium sp. NLF-5-8]
MPSITINLTDADAKRLREHTGAATTRAAVAAILEPLTVQDNPAPHRARGGRA